MHLLIREGRTKDPRTPCLGTRTKSSTTSSVLVLGPVSRTYVNIPRRDTRPSLRRVLGDEDPYPFHPGRVSGHRLVLTRDLDRGSQVGIQDSVPDTKVPRDCSFVETNPGSFLLG